MSESSSAITGPSLPPQVRYWREKWRDLSHIETFAGDLANLDTIHTTLLFMSDELRSGNFANRSVKDYITRRLGQSYEKVPKSLIVFRNSVQMIMKEWRGNRTVYTEGLLATATSLLANGELFFALYSELKKLLFEEPDSPKNRLNIAEISRQMIVECLLKGFDFDAIQSMGNVLSTFDDVIAEGDENLGAEALLSRAIARMERLTEQFTTAPRERTFVFRVEGLTGKEADFRIGVVHFYDPKVIQYTPLDREGEALKHPSQEHTVCVAVKLESLTARSGVAKAVSLIERTFDLIHTYRESEVDLRVIKGDYIVMEGEELVSAARDVKSDEQDFRASFGHRVTDITDRFTKPDTQQVARFLLGESSSWSSTERKIAYSIHWCRKGHDSDRSEDQIMAYWIAIEHLFSMSASQTLIAQQEDERLKRIPLIMETVSVMLACDLALGHIFALHRTFATWRVYYKLKLPEDLIERAQLKYQLNDPKGVRLFVECIPELASHCPTLMVSEQLESVRTLFSNCGNAKVKVQSLVNRMVDELLLIYRYRNKIVHNAELGDPFLPIFAIASGSYAKAIVNRVLSSYNINPKVTLDEIIAREFAVGKSYIDTLYNCPDVNHLEVAIQFTAHLRPSN